MNTWKNSKVRKVLLTYYILLYEHRKNYIEKCCIQIIALSKVTFSNKMSQKTLL